VSSYPTRRYYERAASASGYPLASLERVYRLAALLGEIVDRGPDELLLRGGTALNLLYLEAPRLSVDLDLDYVGTADAGEAQRRRPALLAELEELAGQAGYLVEQSRQSYAMAHLILRYGNTAGRSDALKLDLNFLDRVPVLEPVRLPLRHPFGDDLAAPSVLTFALDELAASKIIALARRGLARDLFDVGELAHLPDLDLEVVRNVLVVRGAAYRPPSPEQYSASAGEQVRLVDWRAQVVALARRDQQVDLVTAQQRAEALLRAVLKLQPAQRQFLRALEAGDLDAALLGDPALALRAQSNPGLLWRLQRGIAELEER
jgi:predicted nucleotidyltransferase component of viral defense system